MSDDEGLAELVKRWARRSSWQFHQDNYDGAPVGVDWEDKNTRVELAFFPADGDAMIELFDRRRARGGVISVSYDDQPGELLNLLTKMGDPEPAKFPSLLSALMEKFNAVYDTNDAEPILIDSAYLETYTKKFQGN